MGTKMKRFNKISFFAALLIIIFLSQFNKAQNDVMMQAFYWNVPVDEVNHNGTWWDTLRIKMNYLKNAGFTGLWVPPPSKGNWGITDMGYGLYDHYDLGAYNQKGSVETRFGSKQELLNMIAEAHNTTNGKPYMNIYADVILNHIYGSEENLQDNPAVKQYVRDEAYRNGIQYNAYPTNEITWVIPNASPGDYYIQIKGYLLDWNANYTQRGYDVFIDWTGVGYNGTDTWEYEPNNGNGQYNVFPGSGRIVRGHADYQGDIDEYKVTVSSTHDLVIKLTARKEGTNSQGQWEWQWEDQTKGYYPVNIWYNGNNLALTTLQARTATNITYPTHTGTNEPNYRWTYTDFHPVDNNDWLGWPGTDEIIPNTKFFGNDLNTYSTTVKTRLKNWGVWLSSTIGFDGYRLDFVRGFQIDFVADWVKNLPLLNGKQRFIVGEYWGADYRIRDWVNGVASYGADVDAFDFPLKFTLKDMCNGNGSSFDMRWLNNAGMVRNNSGNGLPGTSIVTFLDNHDTGKEHDKWVTKDHKMGYAYILTHEGRPCIFYPHYYSIVQYDANDPSLSTKAPSSLKDDINKLIFVRKNYLGGTLSVLSQIGNPYPASDAYNVYVARRQGNGVRDGAIIVINNHDTQTKGLWVDSSPSGFTNWSNTTLVNAFNPSQTTYVYADGRVYVSAPPRSYAIWVKQSDYIAYTPPSPKINYSDQLENIMNESSLFEYKLYDNYPNPFNPTTTINYQLKENGFVSLKVYDILGREVRSLVNEYKSKGYYSVTFDANDLTSGTYIYVLKVNGYQSVKKMMILK